MNTVPRYDPLTFGETALKMRTYRQEVLSSNLVNADTPNFKARDIDFPTVLAAKLSGQADPSSLGLDLTHQAHIAVPVRVGGPNKMFRVQCSPQWMATQLILILSVDIL